MAQIDLLKERIPNDFEDEELYNNILNQLLEDTKNIALANLYPFKDWSLMDLPKRYYNWQLRACIEIKNYLGMEGLKSYSENGLSFSKISDGLSLSIMEELIPEAGTIKRKSTNSIKIYIKRDNILWSSSGIKLALYKGATEVYSDTDATKEGAIVSFPKVENGTYRIYASATENDEEELVDTGIDISINNTEEMALIDYCTIVLNQGQGTTLLINLDTSEGTSIQNGNAILKDSSIYVKATLEPNYKDLILCKNGNLIENESTYIIYKQTSFESFAKADNV